MINKISIINNLECFLIKMDILKKNKYTYMYTAIGSYSYDNDNINQTFPEFINENDWEQILLIAIDLSFIKNTEKYIKFIKSKMNQFNCNVDVVILQLNANKTTIDIITDFSNYMYTKEKMFLNLITNYASYCNINDTMKGHTDYILSKNIEKLVSYIRIKIKNYNYIYFYEHIRCLKEYKYLKNKFNFLIYNSKLEKYKYIFKRIILTNNNFDISKKTSNKFIGDPYLIIYNMDDIRLRLTT